MSAVAELENPTVQTSAVDSAPPAAKGDFNAMLAAELSPNAGQQEEVQQPKQETKAAEETLDPGKTEKTEPKQKSIQKDKGKEAKGDKKKWDFSMDKKEEPKEEEGEQQAAESQSTENPSAPQKIRWDELREKERKLEKEVLPKLEEYEKQIADLKAKVVPENDLKDLEIFRQRYAEELLEEDPGFQAEVMAPIQHAVKNLDMVAERANLNDTQQQALANAIRNPNDVERVLAIQEILSEASTVEDGEKVPLPDKVIDALTKAVVSTADRLHNQLWPKEAERRMAARDLANGAKGRKMQEDQAQKAQQEAQMKEAKEYIGGILKTNLKPLFDDKDLVIDGTHISQAMDEFEDDDQPNTQAYKTYAASILPFAAAKIQKLEGKLRELEGSLKARTKAAPSLSGSVTPEPKKDGQAMSLHEALAQDYKSL